MTEFGVGKVVGQRSWRVTPDGWLTGIYYKVAWHQGVNIAHCLSDHRLSGLRHLEDDELCAAGLVPFGLCTNWKRCTCGNYGFYDGSFHSSGKVHGVIEAWGKTVISEYGFRAEKAQIVALAIPGAMPKRRYQRVPLSRWGVALTLAVLLTSLILIWVGLYEVVANDEDWAAASVGANVVATAAAIRTLWRIKHGFPVKASMKKSLMQKIRDNYPDVEFYDSIEEMLKAHPPDPPPLPDRNHVLIRS